jgi:hypothetical protein
MKKLQYLACSIALFLLVSCSSSDSADEFASTESYELSNMVARGDGGDDIFLGNDNTGSASEDDLDTEAGTLTAGEWNDLKNWGFWQSLMQKEMFFEYQSYWQFFPTQRYCVKVIDNASNPVMDCSVQLLSKDNKVLWQSKTNNSGTAELWSQPFSEDKNLDNIIVINYNGTKQTIKRPETFIKGVNEFQIAGTAALPENRADVMFVVDATGSMEDEISYLKKELADVVSQVKTSKPGMTLQIGSVFYRDKGDEYVTRGSELSANTDHTINFINKQSADGGGDYPEAVDAALIETITNQKWSSSARTRIIFLMLDAPPHHDTKTLKDLQAAIHEASAKGIKLIPIASSGMDKDTEFLMRFFSLITNGSYIFMTDHSGVGNGHIEPTVGEYRVEYLNDMLARIIIESAQPSMDLTE